MKMEMKELMEWIESAIEELKNDDRMAEPATVDTNAPLALIQVSIEGRIHALRDVLRKTAELTKETDGDYRSAPFSREELAEARKEAKKVIDKYDRFIVLGFKQAEDPHYVYTQTFSCCKVRDLVIGQGALKREEPKQLKKTEEPLP